MVWRGVVLLLRVACLRFVCIVFCRYAFPNLIPTCNMFDCAGLVGHVWFAVGQVLLRARGCCLDRNWSGLFGCWSRLFFVLKLPRCTNLRVSLLVQHLSLLEEQDGGGMVVVVEPSRRHCATVWGEDLRPCLGAHPALRARPRGNILELTEKDLARGCDVLVGHGEF